MSTPLHPSPVTDVPARDDDGSGYLVAGAAAALGGGAVWALIVGLTNYEVGYVAWGVGGLVGLAMSRATSARSKGLAATAAALAVVGLLFGKVLIQHFVTGPALAEELRTGERAVQTAAAWALREARSFPVAIQDRLDAMGETDTLPDDLWSEMVAAGEAHAATLSAEERSSLAGAYAATVLDRVGPWRQIAWGFSAWDLLWFGLALTTAWGMLKPPVPAAEEASAA